MPTYKVWVNTEEFLIEITENGAHILSQEAKSTNPDPSFKSFIYQVQGRRVIVQEVKKFSSNKINGSANQNILAPMPGIITSIAVVEGQEVSIGQSVITMESMKMHMELRASVSGTVSKILVRPQDIAEKSSILLTISSE